MARNRSGRVSRELVSLLNGLTALKKEVLRLRRKVQKLEKRIKYCKGDQLPPSISYPIGLRHCDTMED